MSCSQPFDPWLGRSIGDRQRYRITKHIGGGGMGDVFLATDTLLGQPVALKLLKAKMATGEMRKRFEREVAVCAALRSDHIVQVTDYGLTSEGYPFYVMEYLEGQTLGQLLRQEKRLSIKRTLKIMTQICAGVHLAHQGINLKRAEARTSEHVKVVHRDLKPDNIFLLPTALGEYVKILDFGIAKICSDQAEYTNATTAFLGTFQYAAPEQFELEKKLDERADIYSLGMILYQMLTGVDPFGFSTAPNSERSKVLAWITAHLAKPPVPPCQQPGCSNLPHEIEAVVMQCLQKEPDQRPASVMALKQALHSAIANANQRKFSYAATNQQQRSVAMSSTSGSTSLLTAPQDVTAPVVSASPTHNVARGRSNIPATKKPSYFRSHSLNAAFIGGTTALMLGLSLYWMNSSALISVDQGSLVLQDSEFSLPVPAESASLSAKRSLTEHTDTVWAVAISPDGKTLASGGGDKALNLWNLQTGELSQVFSGHVDAIRTIAFSLDGETLATGSGDKLIRIWNAKTGALLRILSGHTGPVWSIAISSDGQTLASGSYDGSIKLWNLQTGQLLQTFLGHYDSVWSVAISPDGKTLASGSYDSTIKLWNMQTGTLIRTLSGHGDAIRSVAISPDGQTLVSGSWDKTVKLWNLQTGEVRQTLSAHADRVLAVAIDSTGKTIASSSIDRTINLWDLQTGALLHTFSGHADWVTAIAFSPQPTATPTAKETLVSGSKDKTIRIWQW